MPTETNSTREPLLRAFMPELDSLRGVAVLLVVIHHAFYSASRVPGSAGVRLLAWLATPAERGVQLFFVLSGFLITGILLESRGRADYYRRFYRRRALRILPPYLLLLAVLLVIERAPLDFVLLAAAFSANLATLIGVSLAYVPLWSLAVEEQYYLLWPSVVRHVSRRTMILLTAALFLLAPFLRWLAFHFGYGAFDLNWRYTWFAYDAIVLGALVALLLRVEGATREVVKRTAALTFVVSLLAGLTSLPSGALRYTDELGATFGLTLYDLFFASVLVLSLVAGTSSWRRLVVRPWLIFLGYISYGLYLCHVLFFEAYDRVVAMPAAPSVGHLVARFAIAGGAAVVMAWVSRRYYEERFLRRREAGLGTRHSALGIR